MKKSIAVLMVAFASIGAQKKTATARYGMPKLRPDQFWISSVPVGLEVHAGPNPSGKLLGKTPLVVDRASIGTDLTVALMKTKPTEELPDQLDLVDFTAKTNHSMMIRVGDKDIDRGRALSYKIDPRRQTLIALFQTRNESLSYWSQRYPRGRNFSFVESTARRDLEDRGVLSRYIDLGIELLRRGGKVALPGRDGSLVAEVEPSGEVAIVEPPR